jgi:hypothetical protein
MAGDKQSDIREIVDILGQLAAAPTPDKTHEHENVPMLNRTVNSMRKNDWALTNTATIGALCDLAKGANDPFIRLIAVADLAFFGINDNYYPLVTETFGSIIANEPASGTSHLAIDGLNTICHYRNDSRAAGKLLIDILCNMNYPHDLRQTAGVECVIGQGASYNIAAQLDSDSVARLIEVLEKENSLEIVSKVAGILSNTAKFAPAHADTIAPYRDKIKAIGAAFLKANATSSAPKKPQP